MLFFFGFFSQMNTSNLNYELKEASVVLNKLSDQELQMISPYKTTDIPSTNFRNEENAYSDCDDTMNEYLLQQNGMLVDSECETSHTSYNIVKQPSLVANEETGIGRKRKRKNDAPKRKVVVLQQNILEGEDYRDVWCSSYTDGKCIDKHGDYQSSTSIREISANGMCGNNNAKSVSGKCFMSKMTEDCSEEKPKCSRTPMFAKKTKFENKRERLTDENIVTIGRGEDKSLNVQSSTSDRDTGSYLHGETYRLRKKNVKRIPIILNRKKKTISMKSEFSDSKTNHSEVRILPKLNENPEKISFQQTTRSVFKDVSGKQSTMNDPSPELRSSTIKGNVESQGTSQSMPGNSSCSLPPLRRPSKKISNILNSEVPLEQQSSCTMSDSGCLKPASFTPLIVSQCALSTSVSPEVIPSSSYVKPYISTNSPDVKPYISKPRYSTRLTSKPGTKYIVRKDSIISANIEDFIEPPPSSWSSNVSGLNKLILKLPDAYLNEKQFYNSFVKKSDSLESPVNLGRVSYDYNQLSPSQQPTVVTLNMTSSPIQPITTRSTEHCTDSGVTDEKIKRKMEKAKKKAEGKSIILQGRGTLDDIKQEMRKTNPDLWKTQDPTTLSDQISKTTGQKQNLSRVRKVVQSQDTTPVGLFLDNLKERLMEKTKLSNDVIKRLPKVNEFEGLVDICSDLVETNSKTRNIENEHDATNVSTSQKTNDENNITTSDTSGESVINAEKEGGDMTDTKKSPTKEYKGLHAPHLKDQKVVIRYAGRQTSIVDIQSAEGKIKLENLIRPAQKERKEVESRDFVQQEPNVHPDSNIGTPTSTVWKYSQNKANSFSGKLQSPFRETAALISTTIKKEPFPAEASPWQSPQKDSKTINTSNSAQGQSSNDHAYTRSETKMVPPSGRGVPFTVRELLSKATKTEGISPGKLPIPSASSQQIPQIPVYAVRCGERVILFPTSKIASQSVNIKAVIPKTNESPKPSAKSPLNLKSVRKCQQLVLKKSKTKVFDFTKKCDLIHATDLKPKKPDSCVNQLVPVNFNTIIPKRPKNQIKHMCSVVVQVTILENSSFSFTKDILALSFTHGSNPSLIRWHEDGIHVALITFSNKNKIQHLTVDHITPGFYCMSLKNNPKIRRNRTFEGLLTSTLPNEDLMGLEKDFLAIGQIKGIMDPTLKKPEVTNCKDSTLTEVLRDVLPNDLMHACNPTISDRSYKPKVNDKAWYSMQMFDLFTKTYGRTRGYHPLNGCRLQGEVAS